MSCVKPADTARVSAGTLHSSTNAVRSVAARRNEDDSTAVGAPEHGRSCDHQRLELGTAKSGLAEPQCSSSLVVTIPTTATVLTMRLEDLRPNSAIRGVHPDGLVTVVSVQWFGSAALELT